ncbi:SMP-30/gluconolactonase/LRE family protein [Catenovulum maritimum]|uniref:SMP-30/Gluconolactonase/LRE-like region domain-containing protein n=1 Tax=Catenovulum maritimum TaxID=1513271 RepID=A0A0J8GWE1_9ALTE|nr:SMP-30/gluconolactonase/LRE family protein [Catenovulum maritimum]KMT67072.1 hypothetical protein XM47_00305 [Catenovulum maritimum]
MKLVKSNQFKKLLLSAAIVSVVSACSSTKEVSDTAAPGLQPAKLFANLPDYCPTPDAFAIAPNGDLTLSCVNYSQKGRYPGVLLNITNQGKVTKLADLTPSNGKGKVRPMGIAYAPDGSLYICDNQGGNQARLLRLTFKGNQVASTEVVAYGMSSPNGLRYHDGALYLTQLRLPKMKSKGMASGLYRFKTTDRNIKVSSNGSSEHLIFSADTLNPDRAFGLDGLVFDSKGNLFTGNLGDGIIYKLKLNNQGKVVEQEVFATVPKNVGPDGINIDAEDNLYLAGFLNNQIIKITPQKQVSVIADYPDNDGSNGQIDQPADLIVYNDKLVISNFDLMKGKGIVNTKDDKQARISYIPLK